MRPVAPAARRQLLLVALGLLAACASAPRASTHVPKVPAGGRLESVTDPGRPQLSLRASRQLGMAPLQVTLYAELQGREDERFYCPEVLWTWPDGTESSTESDCTPWAGHSVDDYERRWSKRVVLGPGAWVFIVTLRKAGKPLAVATAHVEVH